MAIGGSSKTRRRIAIFGGCILILLLASALYVRTVAPSLAAGALERYLMVPVHIDHLEISPFADTIKLTGVRLGQPEGYSDEPMLSAKEVNISGCRGIFSANRRLGEIRVHQVHLNLTTGSEGHTNLKDWIASIAGDREDRLARTKKADRLNLLIERIAIEPIHIVRRDRSVASKNYVLTIHKGTLDILNLAIGPHPGAPSGSVRFHCEIVQPETENAQVMLASQVGPIAADDPMLRSSVRLTGCLYQTFIPVIPPTTDLVLGGEGFDLDLDLAISNRRLQATGAMTTSDGSAYPFRIQGTMDEPVFELPEKLASVAARMGGGMGRLVNSALHSGMKIVVGAIDTVASFGKGALHATGSFLKGAGRTATGVVTLNEESTTTGLDEMTSEAGGHISDAFSESADAVSSAGGRTSEALGTNPRFQKWIEQGTARHNERSAAALEKVFQAPFPPAIPDLEEDAG